MRGQAPVNRLLQGWGEAGECKGGQEETCKSPMNLSLAWSLGFQIEAVSSYLLLTQRDGGGRDTGSAARFQDFPGNGGGSVGGEATAGSDLF